MKLTYVPLLRVQRALYDLPRSPERFARYRALLPQGAAGDSSGYPPLLIVNPMARKSVAARLDEWLSLDADGAGTRATARLAVEVADAPGGAAQVALVLADEAGGGWTDRYAWEFSRRFEPPPAAGRGWLSGVLWMEDTPDPATVCTAVREVVLRSVYVARHGPARTLRERLAQEGAVLAQAAGSNAAPELDPEEMAYTREIIRPHLDSTDRPTAISLLFGDPAARALGYAPAGLGRWAGLILARHEARRACNAPLPAKSPGDKPGANRYKSTPMKPLPSAALLCAAGLLTALGGCVSRIPAPSNEPTTLFRQMDKDRDGKLSRAEFNAGFADAVFNVYNQERTGSVTSEQWNRIQNANNPTGRSAFDELDGNHDGRLTYAELSGGPGRDAVVNRFFDLIDKNRDGSISVDEGRPSGLDRTPQQRAEGEGL